MTVVNNNKLLFYSVSGAEGSIILYSDSMTLSEVSVLGADPEE